MHRYLLSSLILCSFCADAPALSQKKADPAPFFQEAGSVHINNRILAVVNGKAISAIDVAKKMDLTFYRQYPTYANSEEARYQYYLLSWRKTLTELVDKELIIADAKENHMPVSAGDVREELESTFGPNIMSNLEKAGLTFDEAWEIIKSDIMIRRMITARVNSKAAQGVAPKQVIDTYNNYSVNAQKSWRYRVATIRHPNDASAQKLSEELYRKLSSNELTLDNLAAYTKELPGDASKATVTISEYFDRTEKSISEAHLNGIKSLEAKQYSEPLAQSSRSNTKAEALYRIFYLDESLQPQKPPFQEVEKSIKDRLIQAAINAETEKYLLHLRRHYGLALSLHVDDETPPPFVMI